MNRSPSFSSSPSAREQSQWGVPLLMMSMAFLIGLFCAACIGGFALLHHFFSAGSAFPLSSRPIYTATPTSIDFLNHLAHHESSAAYRDLGDVVLVELTEEDFARQARHADDCLGAITSYQIVHEDHDLSVWHLTYAVQRSKWPRTYRLSFTLETDASGAWLIAGYSTGPGSGNALVPGISLCPCHESRT